jgi:hypothetical protein
VRATSHWKPETRRAGEMIREIENEKGCVPGAMPVLDVVR